MKLTSSTRNIVIAVSVSLLAVFLTGCTTPQKGTTAKQSPQSTNQPTDNTPTLIDPLTGQIEEKISKDDLSKIVFAKEFNSPQYYSAIKNSALSAQREFVQQQLSTATDASACEKLSNTSEQNNCKNNFFYQKALQDKKKSFCDSISDKNMKNSCNVQVIEKMAQEAKDPKICNQLETEERKNRCNDVVTFEIARTSGDEKKCTSLSDELLKDMCINEVKMFADEKKRQAEFEKLQKEALESSTQETPQ